MLRKKNKNSLMLLFDSCAQMHHTHTHTSSMEENYILLHVLLFQSPLIAIQVLERETVFEFSSLCVSLFSFYYL